MRVAGRVLGLGLALLGASGCPQPVEPKPKPEIVTQLELRVDVPGMGPEEVETYIIQPIELALVGNSDVREIVSEAREGQARLQLGLSNRAELVAPDVLKRVTEIQSQLPEDVDLPTLRPRDFHATTVYFSLADEHAEAAQTLLRSLEATAGVREVSRCGAGQEVAIELDPEALRRFGVSVTEVERAVRSALLMQSALTVEELPKLALARADGSSIELAQLATIRLTTTTDGCKAHSKQGPTVAFGVTVMHPEARANVDAQLNEARERGVIVQRFASPLHIWLSPGVEPARVVEHIPAVAGAGWMLEVGAEAEPCAGPGTLARLHLPSDAALETVVEALASTPGVAFVEHPDNRRVRRWLVGAEIDELARLGREAAASGASVVLIDGEGIPERIVDIDREKLAELGIARSDVTSTVAMALGGLEVGYIRDAGPVRLRLAAVADLGQLQLSSVNGQAVPLSTVAELRDEVGLSRICRRNGERGVVLLVRPQDAGVRFDVELPAGYRWADDP
jgi:multidrug efflux pump subunit AcrB